MVARVRKTREPPASPVLSPPEIESALRRLRARIDELQAFDPQSVRDRSDSRIRALGVSVAGTLTKIFGEGTDAYYRYSSAEHLDTAGLNFTHETPLYEVIEGLERGKERAITLLNEAVRFLEEELAEAGSGGQQPAVETNKQWPTEIHPALTDGCRDLFLHHQYSEAVAKGFRVVRDRLRVVTGAEKGSEAFGQRGLHIRGAAAAHVDHDFNEGVKFLLMSIDMFRNEKSHVADGNVSDRVTATRYLMMSSLALDFLDRAEIR